MARPGGMSTVRRSCYSGHKRFYCFMYQTITTLDGLIFHMFGPVGGRHPNEYLYRASKIYERLSANFHIERHQYYLYADKANVLRPWMQMAYPHPPSMEAHAVLNRCIKTVLTSVEWSYMELKKKFTFHIFCRMQRVGSSPVSGMYKLSALLLNLKTCI